MMDLEHMSKEELVAMVQHLAEENDAKEERIARLEAEKKALNIRLDELISKYEHKVELNRKMACEKFMPKSEKLTKEDRIINDAECNVRKTPSENFVTDLKSLVTEEVVKDYPFEEAGVSRDSVRKFGEDESYKIVMNAVSFDVVRIKRPKYRDQDHVYQSVSDDPFPHSVLTPSFAANIMTMKYELGIPLNRYSAYLNAHGIGTSPADLSNYTDRTVKMLKPIYDRLLEKLLKNNACSIHCDETPVKVLDSEKDKCYMFVYATSFWDAPIYIYEFSETRKTEMLQKHLKNYHGYITCDAYAGYDCLRSDTIHIQRCFIHCRRYFMNCLKILPASVKEQSPAYKVVELMGILFGYEREFRDKKLTAEEILKKRKSSEYLSAINNLDEYILSIKEGSDLLMQGVNYYINHKNELYTYLDDGHVDMTNNLAERVVKPFALARSAFLFCKTAHGAKTTGMAFSIVQTARANGLNAEKYIAYVLEKIRNTDPDKLMPYSESLPDDLRVVYR